MRTLRTVVLVSAPPLFLAVAGLAHPRHLIASTAAHRAGLRVALLPAFALPALGPLVPLWGRPGRDVDGALTVVVWAGCLGYAAYCSGLDAVAGISAGTVAVHGVHGAVGWLFSTGDESVRSEGLTNP
ncbi:hypothetical protein AB5J72_08580 [Streptomyces sp. CG1]|uniref:hypothetical protein n=1 Tax=Streptomyces sp. CG1 TaxID=1287523 RepID=UPI0034E2CB34